MSLAFQEIGCLYGTELAQLLRDTADRIEEDHPDSVIRPGGCGPQGIRKADGTIVVVEAAWTVHTTDLPIFEEHNPHDRPRPGAPHMDTNFPTIANTPTTRSDGNA